MPDVSTTLPPDVPSKANDRADALAVVRRLRDAGHEAYFAGGCVRDVLLGRQPADWDVATDAPPPRVRELFPRTQAVGAAFGVILVRHRRSQVEVATFRSDGRYADGRHPEAVTFTTAEQDAQRRDFTINGLFLDPLDGAAGDAATVAGTASQGTGGTTGAGRVIDFVGGRADLAARLIRAIGDPGRRFEEDHLRVLRAVRFAARLGFAVEPATAAAVRAHAPMLTRVSPERAAEELRLMLAPPTRTEAWRLLNDLGLARVIFRFVEPPTGGTDESRPVETRSANPPDAADAADAAACGFADPPGMHPCGARPARYDTFFAKLAPGEPAPFPLALAAASVQWISAATPAGRPDPRVFEKAAVGRLVASLRRALRLSNDECDAIDGTLRGVRVMTADAPRGVAALKRFLAEPTAGSSRQLLAAMAAGGAVDATRAAAVEGRLAGIERTDYAPPPLITGDDLAAAGHRPGPAFKRMLDAAYDAQLEGRATTRDEAMAAAAAAAAATVPVATQAVSRAARQRPSGEPGAFTPGAPKGRKPHSPG